MKTVPWILPIVSGRCRILPRRVRAAARVSVVSPCAFVLVLVVPVLRAEVEVSPAEIQFGERGHNERPTETLVLRNGGKAPVTVRQIRASCGCIEISPPSLPKPIPPGGQEEIRVAMSSGRAMGILDKHVTITTDDPRAPVVDIPVRMRVFDGFSMEPRELRFDDGVVGGKPIARTVDITWNSARRGPKTWTLTIEAVKEAGGAQRENPHFEGKISDIAGGRRLELTLKPTHPEGRIWANLEARLDGKTFVIPVVGEMFRWIKVVPTYFNFSRVAADDPSSFVEEVALSSTDDRKFRILSMTPTFRGQSPAGARLELDLKDAVAGKEAMEHVIRARIVPPPEPAAGQAAGGAQGSFSGQVVVKTDHPDKPEVTLGFFGFFAQPPRPR